MNSRSRWELWLLLVLFLAQVATAAQESHQVEASLRVGGTVRFQGLANASSALLGITYRSGDQPEEIQWSMAVDAARLRLMNFPYAIAGSKGGVVGRDETRSPMPEEVITDEALSGEIRVLGSSTNGSYRLLPLAKGTTFETRLNGDHHFELSAPRSFAGSDRADSMGFLTQSFNRTFHPLGAGALLHAFEPRAWNVSGDLFALAYGGDFRVDSNNAPPRVIRTGERLNASKSVTDPSGNQGVWYYDRLVLIVEARAASAQVLPAESDRLAVALASLSGKLDGDLQLADVSGRIEIGGAPTRQAASLLQVIGKFDTDARYEGDAAPWILDGEATFVGVDGLPVAGRPPGQLLPIIGSTVVAASAILVGLRLLPNLIGFLYSRLAPERVLLHPVRSHVLQIVQSTPGVILRDVVAITGRPYGVIRHHARILKTAGRLKILNRGKATHLYLPEHSLTVAKRELILETDPPARFMIEKLQGGVLPQAVLVTELRRAFGLGRASAWKAVQRTVDACLVERIRLDGSINLRVKDPATQ